jgi:hypothetical protein
MSTAYCSAECQKNDSSLHKLLCNKYQDFLKTRLADEKSKGRFPKKYIAALLFPADAECPQLIWLKCSTYDELGMIEIVCTKGILEHIEDCRPMFHTQNEQNIEIWMTDTFPGKPTNKCVKRLTAGYGTSHYRSFVGFPHDWFDNIIVLNSSSTTTPHPDPEIQTYEKAEYHDVTLSDLRYAFQFFTKHDHIFESDEENPYYIHKGERWFKAVKMYCNGDVAYDGKKKYQQVDVSSRHQINFSDHDIASITQEMGFPLRVRALPVDQGWRIKWQERTLPK